MRGTVIVPWYATGFRAEGFEQALNEVTEATLRYGADSYAVYRARDDRYKFQQLASFPEHIAWERFWDGPEMIEFRTRYSGWYQIPVLYGWWDQTAAGQIERPLSLGSASHANGQGNGTSTVESERA